MLAKCANPECFEVFRFLHQGKVFCLSPTPDLQKISGTRSPSLRERFWLCDGCSREMTLVWGGANVKLVHLPVKTAPAKASVLASRSKHEIMTRQARVRATTAGRNDG